MAEGDAIPRQSTFPQAFSPYPGDLTKGSLMRNCYRETRPDGEYAVRRGGLTQLIDTVAQGPSCKGLVVYSIAPLTVGPTTYYNLAWAINATSLIPIVSGVTTVIPSAAAATTFYTFTPTKINNNEPGLLTPMGGTSMWIIQTAGVSTIIPTLIAAGAPPTNLTPGGAFLDGTAYVMSVTDNQIHGSNLQDLTTWNALNVVGASSSWGKGVGITRHLNYILGFFEYGLQVYYNAGLAPPGSPLAPLPNASFLVGCVSGATVTSIADTTIFVGKSQAGNYSVYRLAGLSLDIISTPPVDELLKRHKSAFRLQFAGENPWVQTAIGMSYTDKGHMLYLLKLKGIVTLAWDTSTREWFVWDQERLGSVDDWLPDWIIEDFTANQDAIAGQISNEQTVDYSGAIHALIRTANADFGSAYKKFIQKISFWGQSIAGTMTVRYSDDDYNIYSTPLGVDLSKVRKMINRQGSFYQRAYEYTYSGSGQFRLRISEILLRGGST